MSWWRATPPGASRCLHVLFMLPGAQAPLHGRAPPSPRVCTGASVKNKAAVCWAPLLPGRLCSDHGIPGMDGQQGRLRRTPLRFGTVQGPGACAQPKLRAEA